MVVIRIASLIYHKGIYQNDVINLPVILNFFGSESGAILQEKITSEFIFYTVQSEIKTIYLTLPNWPDYRLSKIRGHFELLWFRIRLSKIGFMSE